jgi:hypothetical protein
MTIRELADFRDTNKLEDDEIDKLVASIINSLDSSPESYNQASQMYGMVFFQGESLVFKQKLCFALAQQFSKFQNSFWNKFKSISDQP